MRGACDRTRPPLLVRDTGSQARPPRARLDGALYNWFERQPQPGGRPSHAQPAEEAPEGQEDRGDPPAAAGGCHTKRPAAPAAVAHPAPESRLRTAPRD